MLTSREIAAKGTSQQYQTKLHDHYNPTHTTDPIHRLQTRSKDILEIVRHTYNSTYREPKLDTESASDLCNSIASYILLEESKKEIVYSNTEVEEEAKNELKIYFKA